MNPVPFTTLAAVMDFVVGDRNYPLSELFMKGGFIMWPLLLLSIAGVVVLVMCCFSTRAAAVLPTKLVEQAESFIRKRDYTGLSILCKNGDSCYARVMLTVANFMLRNPSAQFEEVREIASAEGGRQAGVPKPPDFLAVGYWRRSPHAGAVGDRGRDDENLF